MLVIYGKGEEERPLASSKTCSSQAFCAGGMKTMRDDLFEELLENAKLARLGSVVKTWSLPRVIPSLESRTRVPRAQSLA